MNDSQQISNLVSSVVVLSVIMLGVTVYFYAE
jgi:hypothetical protein